MVAKKRFSVYITESQPDLSGQVSFRLLRDPAVIYFKEQTEGYDPLYEEPGHGSEVPVHRPCLGLGLGLPG